MTEESPNQPGQAPPPGYGSPGQGYPQQGYPPAGYPQQGYPPPGYGPGWAPGYGYPQVRGTNVLAIAALVSIFVFPPAALVFGLIARSQIKQTGEAGDGMALAGIIVGGLTIAFFLLVFVGFFVFAVGASSAGVVEIAPMR